MSSIKGVREHHVVFQHVITSPHYNVAASEMSNKEYIFCFFYFSIMYYCIHIFKVTKLDLNKKCLSIYKCIFPSLASQNLYFNVRFE